MSESDILYTAVEHLEKLTRTRIDVQEPATLPNGHPWDALLNIHTGTKDFAFKVEIKGSVLPSNLPRLTEVLNRVDALLVANYISNPAKELLEKQGVNYLEASGDCWIRRDDIYWYFKGQSKTLKNTHKVKHKAFQKNGIKLVFALLLDASLLNKPYREIAVTANISASTVGDILTDLIASKFLLKITKNEMKLINKPELLEHWVNAYNQKLKPKIIRGQYRFRAGEWPHTNLGDQSFWGAEPAADLLTNFLHPGKYTIFSNIDRRRLMADLQLLPDQDKGDVTVCSIFWPLENKKYIFPEFKTVHPLLVYADLLGSGIDRNFETAKRIYELYLKNIIE
jgi:hypothetical protein